MNFLVDESVDQQIVERLRQDGHEILYVAEMEPGISDDDVLEVANQHGALLLPRTKISGSSSSASIAYPRESFSYAWPDCRLKPKQCLSLLQSANMATSFRRHSAC
jgi:hypothetical protein